MSDHTEWAKIWVICQHGQGTWENWPHFTYNAEKYFHIHDARHHLKSLREREPKAGWQILHAYGYYPPEDWVGVPSHWMHRDQPRAPKPAGFRAVGHVPSDYDKESEILKPNAEIFNRS